MPTLRCRAGRLTGSLAAARKVRGDALKLRDEADIALGQAQGADVLVFDLPY